MKTLYRQKRLTHRAIGENILRFFGNVLPHVAVKFLNYKCDNNLEEFHPAGYPEVVRLGPVYMEVRDPREVR